MINNTYQLEKKVSSKLELLFFYLLFTAAIYFVYIKTSLALPFFIILLILSWFSKRDYFWLAFFFLILDNPAGFFVYTENYHLPLIRIAPGASLAPVDCFVALMMIKIFLHHKHLRLNLILKIPLVTLFIYCIFSFFWGIMFYSETLKAAVSYIRPVIYFFWYIFFTALIKSEENVFRFLRLFFPVVFFLIFTQLYFLSTGSDFISLFDPLVRGVIATNTLTGELRPLPGAEELILLCYIGSLMLIKNKEKIINKFYVYLVGITAYLSIFISATRVLFALFTAIFIGVFSRSIKEAIRLAAIVLLTFLLMFALVRFGIISTDYIKYSAWDRVSQVFMFFVGKGEQIDTYSDRLMQLDVLKEKITENMIVGYGFSTTSMTYYNNNWGAVNTLLVLGIIGLLLYVLLFVAYFKMMASALRKTRRENIHRESLKILLVSFISMLGAHCFTWDFFTPFYAQKIAFIMIFFGISEIITREAIENEKAANAE